MDEQKQQRRGLPWWLGIAAMVVVGAAGGWWTHQKSFQAKHPAAFVMPLEAEGQMGGPYWKRTLTRPVTLLDGTTLRIPEGQKLGVAWADGRWEEIAGPYETVARVKPPSDLSPLRSSARALTQMPFLPPWGVGGSVRVLSPVGVTRFTDPTLTWLAAPDTLYDVAVIDANDPAARPRVKLQVRPPLRLSELNTTEKRLLRPGVMYELIVREAGTDHELGAARFLVTSNATAGPMDDAPARRFEEAFKAMSQAPYRTGDAWMALEGLPPWWLQTDLGRRLALAVSAELGFQADFEELRQSLLR